MKDWVSQSPVHVHSHLVLCHAICTSLSSPFLIIVTCYLGQHLPASMKKNNSSNTRQKEKDPTFPKKARQNPLVHPLVDAQNQEAISNLPMCYGRSWSRYLRPQVCQDKSPPCLVRCDFLLLLSANGAVGQQQSL